MKITNNYNERTHNVRSEKQKTCFLVYSTRESHVVKVIERLADLLSNDLDFSIIKLDEARVAGTMLLPDILKYTKECDLGIVILDGLRPNVTLELGMLLANKIPCIILLERTAKINIRSLVSDVRSKVRSVPSINIDVSKHISDISNTSWNEYSLEDDVAFRTLIRNEIRKLSPLMRQKQSHSHKKYPTGIVSLLKRIDGSTSFSVQKHKRLIAEARSESKSLPKDQCAHVSFHIARSFLSRGEQQTAFREVVNGLTLSPTYDQLLALKGKILFMLGQQNEGLRIIKSVYLKDSSNKYLRFEYLKLLNLAKKQKSVLKIISGMSYESLLMENLIPIKSEALLLNGQVAASLKLLLELYEYDSNYWALHHIMFLLYNQIHEALPKELILRIQQNVQRAIEHKHVRCYNCFALGSKAIGLTNFARKFFLLSFKEEKKKNADNLNEYAFIFMELGEYRQARIILQNAIRKYPTHSYLNATWGLYKFQIENDINTGKKFYSKAIDLKPGDLPLKRMYYFQLGKFYSKNRNKVQAKKYFVRALDIPTNNRQTDIQHALDSL